MPLPSLYSFRQRNVEETMATKVTIKDLGIPLEVKTNGLEFDISDGGHIGDLYVTKTGIIWCEGRITRPNGRKISWKQLRDSCKNNP
jgi:hypothetical protein